MTDRAWFVTVRGAMSDDARGAITAAGFSVTGGHGGGAAPPSGPLPEISSHTLRVVADSDQGAVEQVRQALEGHALFVDETARPAQ